MSGMDRYGEGMLITRLPTPASPTSSSFPRTSSPGPDLFTSRLGFNPQDGQVTPRRHMKFTKNVVHSPENRSRSNSKSADKGKESIRGHAVDDMSNFGREHYVPHYNRTSPYISHDKTRPSTADGNLNGRSRNRGSLLVAASDALGFRFGRRKPTVRQLPSPVILPDVIEISARRDEEDEERNHLKQMAAQAIGLSPFMVSPDRQSREDSTSEEDYDEGNRASGSQNEPSSISDSVSNNVGGRSPHGSSLSVSVNSQQPLPGRRYRSGSVSHSHSNSLTLAPIPPFPTSVAALSSFKQRVGDFPKYYPPSSLRLFALSKNWKTRYLILSSPATLVTRSQSPAVSYLHLYKSSNREEKELERLEINEDSVIFVSEEEVGGKRHVIKVGGADVGAMKKEYTHEEGGHTMWLLQISDPAEAQKWITDIKNAILGQRTVRAGLIPRTVGNNEPHGDMDVMLTIRAQGLVTSPNSSRNSQALSPINTSSDLKGTYASSISSHSVRSQTTVPKSPTSGAVQTLKGLFANSVRPRSSSRAASIDSERQLNRESTANEDSFTSRGSNLLSMLRSSTPDAQSINTNSGTPAVRNLPLSGPVTTVERRIDRKILSERPPVQWVSTEPISTTVKRERFAKGFSLQPPPRKRWVSMGGAEAGSQDIKPDISVNGDSSRRASLNLSVASTERAETEPPSSPGHLSAFQITPEQRPRAPSLQSVSTYASADNALSLERSSSSTKRSSGARSARRWSRQSALPNRLTPPTEPPPAIPTLRTSLDTHPAIPERAVTPTSVQSSDKSVVSSLPSFSKRASGSSARSINSFSTSHSNAVSASSSNFNTGSVSIRTAGSHRTSMPPPRPAPTFALPPAPTEHNQDVLKPLENIPSTSKSSFRNSVANRTFRLSTIAAPKPPPSTTLPPRPDEPEFKTHRRSNSGSSTTNMNIHSTKLETIPGSPIPPPKVMNPFPPPVGPLPPTPVFTLANGPPLQSIPLPKRATSIKQRLRGLSASSVSPKDQSIKSPSPRPFMSITTAPSPIPISVSPPPATPIAEKITLFQNDPSFLQMHTPILQPRPPPPTLLASLAVEEVPEVTSLSPPPRRGSKQLFETELEPFRVPAAVEAKVNNITTTDVPTHLSLSRPGSIISHHSHHSQDNLDLDHVHVHEHEHEHEDGDWESSRDETPSEQLSEFPEENMPSPRHMSLSRPGSIISLGVAHV